MGKLMAFSQERPAEGMEGRKTEERQSGRPCASADNI